MNRNANQVAASRRHIALAKRRVAQGQIPRGAPRGIMAGQQPAQQYAQQQYAQQQYAQNLPVPQGAHQGVMAGCGYPNPAAFGYGGYGPLGGAAAPGTQWGGSYGCPPTQFSGNFPAYSNAVTSDCIELIPILIDTQGQPGTVTCEIDFPGIFNAYGLKVHNKNLGPGEIILESLTTGWSRKSAYNKVDLNFWADTDQCYCPISFCTSGLTPAEFTVQFNLVGSVVQPLSATIVGESLEADTECLIPSALISPTFIPQSPVLGPVGTCVPEYGQDPYGYGYGGQPALGPGYMNGNEGMNGNGAPANNPWG